MKIICSIIGILLITLSNIQASPRPLIRIGDRRHLTCRMPNRPRKIVRVVGEHYHNQFSTPITVKHKKAFPRSKVKINIPLQRKQKKQKKPCRKIIRHCRVRG